MEITLFVLYGLALLFIFIYSMVQINLVYHYLTNRKFLLNAKQLCLSDREKNTYPIVTIQLPIYNELYVVERLIDTIAQLNYPKDKLEIQVLDDSTDETVDIITKKVNEWQTKGIDIKHIRRLDRVGYKAGALDYGLQMAKGEFISIFDADFIPNKDFLMNTLCYFDDDKIGMVQTKWGHLNRNYSLLTRLQAFGLDAHFTVEQTGRNIAGHFTNFNGTAGVWRKACINDAGGWNADTITEDLDLSYRAQLKGWQFKYLENIDSPAELPAAMNALKSQQFRWTKGAAETAKKNLGAVLKAKLPFSTKLHATFHLMNSMIFLCVLTTALLSVPLLVVKHYSPQYNILFNIASFFLISLLALGIFYWASLLNQKLGFLKTTYQFFITFPLFLSVSMGLSLHNSIAVVEGYLGIKSAFIRTPKFNIIKMSDKWTKNKYLKKNLTPVTFLEGLLSLYFLGAMVLGYYYHDFGLFVFHFMLWFGFTTVFYYSIRNATIK